MRSCYSRIPLLLAAACLCGLLAGCDSPSVPSDSSAVQTEAVITKELVRDGITDYTLIIGSESPDKAYSALYNLNRALGGKMAISADYKEPQAHEIIFGDSSSREEVRPIKEKLAEAHTADAFRYVIAEVNDKLVILSEADDGYIYAVEHILNTYVDGKTLAVPEGLFDVQAMKWTDYIAQQEEEARLKEEKKQAQAAAELDELKKQVASFKTSDFGKITKLNADYGVPSVTPQKGQHPRVLFDAADLERIRANLTAEENAAAYAQYVELSEKKITGKLPRVPGEHNVDYTMLGVIEAKAFRYILTGEETFGYQAISAIKNYMLTLQIPDGTILDYSRPYGQVMYTAALVYDWCYPLMTGEDKEQFTAGVETILGPPMEVGFPPSKQGVLSGHGAEAQILRDWYAFSIAAYDEYPDIYDFVAGRIYSLFVEASDYMLASGSHWQGSAYGAYRYYFLLFAESLYRGMAQDRPLFSDKLEDVAITFVNYIRPDNQAFRVGDDYSENNTHYGLNTYYQDAFFASALYGNPILKGFSKTGLKNFSSFSYSNAFVSPVIHLILNDPALGTEAKKNLPLILENGSPLGSVIARASWEKTEDNPAVYMKIGEAYTSGHEHKEAGNFQIYYNGILASDSGSYFNFGTEHDYAYHKQTVAANSILVYNPDMKDNGKWIYSGGQKIDFQLDSVSLDAWKRSGTTERAKILGMEGRTEGKAGVDEKYIFSYLAGDLTNAYDSATVSEVSRYMLSAMTDDAECPMVFVTYDRITAQDANYKKTVLLHMQQEPKLTDDGFAIITNTKGTNSGKLVVQSCITDTAMTAIGGEGKQYTVNGKHYPNNPEEVHPASEFGWGRIEISPVKAAQTDRILTVMYVTDAKNESAPVKAVEIETDELAGAVIFRRAMLFPKEAGRVEKTLTFSVSGNGEIEYYLADVHGGSWSVSVNGKKIGEYEVSHKGGILTFSAGAGDVTVTPVKLTEPEEPKQEKRSDMPGVTKASMKRSFDMESTLPSITGAENSGTKKDGALLWTNPAGTTAGAQFYHTNEFKETALTVSVDLSIPAGESALNCLARVRPIERNKIETNFLQIINGQIFLPGLSDPVGTLNEKVQTLTFVLECDNAGLAAAKNAGPDTLTTSDAYKSSLSIRAYIDGKEVGSTRVSTFLTFGDSYMYNDGSAAFSSQMITVSFYSGARDAGSGSLIVDNFTMADGVHEPT